MKMFVKKRIPLFVGVAAVLGLAQCDWIRADVSRVFSPPVEMDFPMGEGKQISYPIRSWIDKPYGMRLVLEYVNWDKSNDHDVQKEIPFSFSVSCFHMEHDKEILFFQRHYTQADELYLGGGIYPNNLIVLILWHGVRVWAVSDCLMEHTAAISKIPATPKLNPICRKLES